VSASFVVDDADGWTLRTNDGSLVAQFEHTMVVTGGAPIVSLSSFEESPRDVSAHSVPESVNAHALLQEVSSDQVTYGDAL